MAEKYLNTNDQWSCPGTKEPSVEWIGKKIGLLFSTDSLHLKHKVIKCFNFDPRGASPSQSTAGRVKVTGKLGRLGA